MADFSFPDDVDVRGDLTVRGSLLPALPRASLAQDDAAIYQLPLENARVHDAIGSLLPTAGAADDLGLEGVFGTSSPHLSTGDLKAAGATTRYAFLSYPLPPEYVAGQTVTLRISAGMETTVADTTATVDVEAYISDREIGIGSDICATAATSCNSLTFADLDFTITPTTADPGDLLLLRIAVAVNDAATGTAVIATIGAVELLLDVKG